MAEITLKGNTCNTSGDLPTAGSDAPAFTLVGGDLGEVTLESLKGKKVVLNIVPSFDTGTCATSVKTFNAKVGDMGGAVVVNVSKDLPFAQKRFCDAEGVEHVTSLSAFRCQKFASDYGVGIEDGPLKGLLARAVVVVDADGKIVYSQLVPEIVDEPDYDAAIAAL
jgi:thiol peroxidase